MFSPLLKTEDIMEFITSAYENPKTGKVENLNDANLPKPATFVCLMKDRKGGILPTGGLEIVLVPAKEVFDETQRQVVKVADTGCRIKFRGGYLEVRNKSILDLIMHSNAYERGDVQINKEDPTGFWRDCGAVEEIQVPTFKASGSTNPGYDTLNLKAVTKPDPANMPKTLSRVI